MSAPKRGAGHDAWLDALADGEGYALLCPDGHGSLPPRRVCPECGAESLTEEPLAETGTVETRCVVHVAGPRFIADAPYVTAIADFGPVRLTGVVRGVDPDPDAVALGDRVTVTVGQREADGAPLVAFRPADGE
jgi:uncharacterized OB-fold protein